VRTRALSLTLYFMALMVGIIVVPLVVIGPTWLGNLLPPELDFLSLLYWPVVTIVTVASIATLFHVSTPRRTPWLRHVPGAVLTLLIWVLASFVLRGTIAASLGGTSIYGPLSAPIVLLIWLYALAIAVLIGAALNAAVRILWPVEERPSARAKFVDWARDRFTQRRAKESRRKGGWNGADGVDDEELEGQEALAASIAGLREEARRPLTPLPDSDDEGQFGDDDDNQIMSVRTRSG
jgi:membrane protein